MGRATLRLLQKKLGFRTLFDVIPLDPNLVRGSHGLPMNQVAQCPVFIGDGPAPAATELRQTDVYEMILNCLSL